MKKLKRIPIKVQIMIPAIGGAIIFAKLLPFKNNILAVSFLVIIALIWVWEINISLDEVIKKNGS